MLPEWQQQKIISFWLLGAVEDTLHQPLACLAKCYQPKYKHLKDSSRFNQLYINSQLSHNSFVSLKFPVIEHNRVTSGSADLSTLRDLPKHILLLLPPVWECSLLQPLVALKQNFCPPSANKPGPPQTACYKGISEDSHHAAPLTMGQESYACFLEE